MTRRRVLSAILGTLAGFYVPAKPWLEALAACTGFPSGETLKVRLFDENAMPESEFQVDWWHWFDIGPRPDTDNS